MTTSVTLRELLGLGHTPNKLSESALVLIDCQNTYREGVMQLEGVEDALLEAQKLLEKARQAGIPVIHIQHDTGEGTPYDIKAPIGQIADIVKPMNDEPVITKQFPNAFVQTDLEAQLKQMGCKKLVLAGFMTHMCVNSTAHGAFNLGFDVTVVASATATRALQADNGKALSAQAVHEGALASTRDLYAAVVDNVDDLPV
ncbi:cysteine hydrolase family protein [Vreelandella gomseomensis]|uniref:Cysteine hydrolase family protein n=1 Tax=Vreelandella gomseomensis TaxID=370766 RepID=A0ABU1GE43_9GAMM|nr:cysteine hydrolase family protein [Halomonas gomseomensis]MDR5875756.1 cysteine hydrolase family protein [Halomonas gomseomensis]